MTKNKFKMSAVLYSFYDFGIQVTTCYGGRNRKVAEAFVIQKKSIAQLEEEMLNGQKLQVWINMFRLRDHTNAAISNAYCNSQTYKLSLVKDSIPVSF